jgi:hypothetical protein
MSELVIRFLVGGLMVSAFAVLGDVLKPRTFAGVFAAAPSVALASLLLSHRAHGAAYVAIEGRSMILGAVALFVYSGVSGWFVRRDVGVPWLTSLLLWVVWLAVALPAWRLVIGS